MARLPIPFVNHRTYPGHSGVDFPQPRGTLVRASGNGIVGRRTSNPRGGNLAWIDYDGIPGVGYAHLDDYRDSPAPGTRVRLGDPICRVGNSGFSTGPHLHMEVNGHATTAGFWRFFDPNNVVGGGSAAGGGGKPLPIPDPVKEDPIMELVIKAPNGTVVHLAPGIKHDFTSPAEYGAISADLERIRKAGGTDAMPLPPLNKVEAVSWEAYIRFCAYFNVPTAPA